MEKQNGIRDELANIPALLLTDCWTLIAAERKRISQTPARSQLPKEAFTPAFLRSLYIRSDTDQDGTLSMEEMHSLLCIYFDDLLPDNLELPREFTESVTRAVVASEGRDFVQWSDFLQGFPVAVRQGSLLWEQYLNRPDMRNHDEHDTGTSM